MQVDENSAAATYEFKGKTYYFCAPGCKADFEKDPEKYLGRGQAQQPPEGHAGHH